MNRITGLGAVLCVAVSVAACGASDATGPGGPSGNAGTLSASAANPLTGPRAVKGYIDGSDQYGDFCGGGQGILLTSTGTGIVSHFGNTVMVSTVCFNLTDLSVIGPWPFSLKAANGDEVEGLVTSFVFTSYGFDLYASITGGTGRFEGATGDLVFPTESTGSGVWSSGVEGWITY